MTCLHANAEQWQSVDARKVALGGEMGRRIEVTIQNNILVIDTDDDFLEPFQKREAGSGYVGLGKHTDALVRLAACSKDEKLLALREHVIEAIAAAQQPDGYIGIMKPDARVKPLWDVHEMSYLVLALAADYEYFGEERSLDTARKLAGYLLSHLATDPPPSFEHTGIAEELPTCGLEEAMLRLARVSGDEQYFDFCLGPRNLPEWNREIVIGRWGDVAGHAYAYLCRCLAQLRACAKQPDERLLSQTRRALDFLLEKDGLLISGCCGDHECWHDSQAGTTNAVETCTTAYFIRLLDQLLLLEGNPLYGDLMERAIFNTLFGAQSPDGRKIRYYTPFETPRKYFDKDTYCCPCNFRRIISELPGLVYYLNAGAITLNLYTPSTAQLALDDGTAVKLTQETDYPASGNVAVTVGLEEAARFALRLRIPRWCDGAQVAVNGEKVEQSIPGGTLFNLERTWHNGDRLELTMPMEWRFIKGRQAQSGRVAIARGPMVFGVNRAAHEALAGVDLRLLTVDADSLEGPFPDDSVRPGGVACKVRAWGSGAWYPHGKTNVELTLTEFADPGCEAVYFHVPNPNDERFVHDELIVP